MLAHIRKRVNCMSTLTADRTRYTEACSTVDYNVVSGHTCTSGIHVMWGGICDDGIYIYIYIYIYIK